MQKMVAVCVEAIKELKTELDAAKARITTLEDKMAKTTIPAGYFAAGSIATADIADDAVTADKLAANSVVSASIVNGTIATADIADDAITSAKIATTQLLPQ